MSKVKKPAARASVRNAKPKGAPAKPSGSKAPERRAAGKGSARKGTTRKAVRKKDRKPPAKVARVPKAPIISFEVKELDPIRKCGAGTSVELLFKVVERVDARSTNHLVFLDRHGWYCEHGRSCPAVVPARKHKGQLARAS